MTLVKADLGIKRVCPSCNARFYDLQKRPIACPKCEFSFDPEALYKQRRPRQPEPEKARVVEVRDEEEELEDAEEMEAAETDDEAGIQDEGAIEEADEDEEIAEEEGPEGAGMSVVDPAAEEAAELEEIEADEIPEEDVEDPTLLEDVGEEEDDVSGIIDADLEKDER